MAPRRRLRIASRVFIAVAILIVAVNGVFLAEQLTSGDDGDGGFVMLAPPQIAAVTPGGPAARAGLRTGDRVDVARLDLHGRLTVLGVGTPLNGERVAIPIVGESTATTHIMTFGPVQTALDAHTYRIVWSFVALAIGAFALAVLARRPVIEAFALATMACVYFGWVMSTYRAPDWIAVGDTIVIDMTSGVWVGGAVILALRVTHLSRNKRFLEWLALGVGLFLAALNAYTDVMQIVLGRPPNPVLASLNVGENVDLVVFVLLVVPIVAIAFARASGMARVRLRWITVGFACFICEAAIAYVQNMSPALYNVTWLAYLRPIFAVAGMGTLGVAIMVSDVFDVGFVVNRAAIYAVITGLLVGAFAALNWLIGSALKSTGLALPIGVVLAAAAALSLRAIQASVTGVVDRVLFRERYNTERCLARIARAVPLLGDEAALARALVDEPVEALHLSAGALYCRTESGSFDLVTSTGWPTDVPQTIESADPLIIHATGAPDVLALDDIGPLTRFPNGTLRPRTAIAAAGPNGPAAIVLFTAHRSGAALDPDETAALERIVVASSVAFERLRTATAQRRLDLVISSLILLHDRLTAATPD